MAASTPLPTRSSGFRMIRSTGLLLLLSRILSYAVAAPLSLLSKNGASTFEGGEEPSKDASDPDLYLYLGIAVALVLLGGVFAGLTIALMGQDETYLQVMATSGEGSERKHAEKMLNLLRKGKHWVLVTLLLSNVITNETLPIVLDRSLGGGWPAVLSSTVLIVIFGEIAPQSVCVRYGLSIGAFMAPFVLVLMWIMSPIAWPTAKLLDWILGADHGTMYKKSGLKTLVQLHKTLGTTPGERLMEDEVTIINSVLDLKEKPVGHIMTPMQDVFIMSADTVLDEPMMDTILSQGYSRIPIYAPDNQRNFIGMLLVKMLITYDPEDARKVRDFSLATLPETSPTTSCLDIINFFQEGKSHMVLVSDFPGQDKGAMGVVTLEDVIEELIGEEIIDESDVFVDVHKAIRRMAPAPYQRYHDKKRASLDPAITLDSVQDPKEDEALLVNDVAKDRQASLPNANGYSSFLVRRKSSTASDGVRDVLRPVRTNTAELKEHMKHLGPSNAAKHPRATKFTNVKIKPGVDSIPENTAIHTKSSDDSGQEGLQRSRSAGETQRPIPSRAKTADGNEGSSLLRSAGRDASDGAAALRAGYGTLSTSVGKDDSPAARGVSAERREREGGMSASEASAVAQQKALSPKAATSTPNGGGPTGSQVPGKVIVGATGEENVVPSGDGTAEESESRDHLGVLPSASTRSRSRSATGGSSAKGVRSGSITETEVEFGGMKKVVLDISTSDTSSSDNTETDQADGKGVQVPLSSDEEEDGQDGDVEGDGSKKKRRRRKRGKKKTKKGDANGES